MAASPLPFLVSLILFFSLSPLSLCATESLQLFPSPATPKTAAVQYWNLKVRNNKPLPPAFLSKLSSQSPLELLITDSDNMKSMAHDEISEKLRTWAIIYHDEMREKIRTWPLLYHEEMREKVRTWAIIYHDEMREEMLRKKLLDDIFVKDGIPGICFREGDLKQGNVMPFVDFRGLFPPQHFVPRLVASKMPFASADGMKKMFHISPATSKGVEETVKLCNRAVTSPDEQKKCISSAEDMIDYVIQTLGSDDIEARSTESTRGCGSDIMIGDLKVLNGGKFTDVVTCHQMQFPYLVQYCHSIAKTRVYEVEILDAETKERINHAIATCHMISMRHPADAASKMPESEPGHVEVCHFISPWDMVWTAAAADHDAGQA